MQDIDDSMQEYAPLFIFGFTHFAFAISWFIPRFELRGPG